MSVGMKDSNGNFLPVMGAGTSQIFTVSNSSVQSAAFGSTTTIVRLAASLGHCHFEIGANPTASVTTSAMMPINSVEYLRVNPGEKIAVIKDSGVANSTFSLTQIL